MGPTNEPTQTGPRWFTQSPAQLLIVSAGFSLATCAPGANDDNNESREVAQLRQALQGLRYDEEALPNDPSNRVANNERAVVLGQRLFFDPSLSGPLIEGDNDGSDGTLGKQGEPGKVSCASCHVPQGEFVDTRSPHGQISLASMWTRRRTPSLLDVAFSPFFNWDGRHDSLWSQATGVIESHVEFNSGRLFVATQIAEQYRADYEDLFSDLAALENETRFPRLPPEEAGCKEIVRSTGPEYVCRGKPGDGAEYDDMTSDDQRLTTEILVNVGKSLAAYVSQLRCGPSRFDSWLDGDELALNGSEVRGAQLFAGDADCIACHSGPLLTDGQFHNVGLAPATVAVAFTDLNDRGAAEALPLLENDEFNTQGVFSDGERAEIPAELGPELEGAFRTPGLRCLSEQPSFMHTGQFKSLTSVLTFFNEGGHFVGYPGENELTPLGLNEQQLSDLAAFLRSLDGPGPDARWLEPPQGIEHE